MRRINYVSLQCPQPTCGFTSRVRMDFIVIEPCGVDIHRPGHHLMSWTCPTCVVTCRMRIKGRTGAQMIERGAEPHVPTVRTLLVADDGAITFDADTTNEHGQRRRLCQHFAAEQFPARNLFADDREADYWLARALHPAGGES